VCALWRVACSSRLPFVGCLGHTSLVNADRLREQWEGYVRCGRPRAELLPPEREKSAVPLVVHFWRNMDLFKVIANFFKEVT
jgi:hypothetical protein